MLRFVEIILLCIMAAIVYGIVHDQITARICVEYFTVFHPPVFETDDPTLLGLGWGVIATWWVGLIMGVLLASAARFGSWPKFTARQLIKPLTIMLLCTASLAVLAGSVSYLLAVRQMTYMDAASSIYIVPEHRVGFLVDLWAHLASYIGGFFGGSILSVWVVFKRRRISLRPLAA